MRRSVLWLLTLWLCAAPRPARAELDFRGLAVGLWSMDPGASYAMQLHEVRAMGANAVLFPVLTYVDTVTGSTVYRLADHTVPDAVVRRAINDAHALGLQVALMPIVRIEHRVDREWRGQLVPEDRDAFFDSYRNMVVHYAKLAAAEQVDLFLMGSEMATLEDAPHWFPLIARLREIYSGRLSYSANWDHYDSVPFWDQLDALALTGYYELSRTTDPTQELLDGSWRWIRNRLLAWRERHPEQRIIFTEVGYHSQDGTAMTPWDYTMEQPVDLEEQRMCYAAFVNAWRDEPALGGVFFWEWSGAGGPTDGHYTPRGKPAAAVLREFFTRDGATAAAAE